MKEKEYEIRPYLTSMFQVYWRYKEDEKTSLFSSLFNIWKKISYLDYKSEDFQFLGYFFSKKLDYFFSEKDAEKWIDEDIRYDKFKETESKIDRKAGHAKKYPPRRYP